MTGCTIFGNSNDGVFLDISNDDATFTGNIVYGDQGSSNAKQVNGIVVNSSNDTISGNTVYDHSGTGISGNAPGVAISVADNLVYGNGTGIFLIQNTNAAAAVELITGNTVRNNISIGISVHTYVLVSNNTIYGQSASNANGIYGDGSSEIADNVIYGNYFGIYTYYGGLNVHNNRLYDNTYIAISMDNPGQIVANDLYSNNIGIQVDLNFAGPIEDNLVYASTTDGILVETSNNNPVTYVVNNTVYQVSGAAVRLDSGAHNVELLNNILWVLAGDDLYVADDSHTGFNSDYNDLYAPSANVGFWNSACAISLSDWQTASGQDAHSVQRQPRFRQQRRRRQSARLHPGQRRLCRSWPGRQLRTVGRLPGNRPRRLVDGAVDRHPGDRRRTTPGPTNQGALEYFPVPANPQPAYPSGGTRLNFNSNNSFFSYTLPFSFTFYGQTYTSV